MRTRPAASAPITPVTAGRREQASSEQRGAETTEARKKQPGAEAAASFSLVRLRYGRATCGDRQSGGRALPCRRLLDGSAMISPSAPTMTLLLWLLRLKRWRPVCLFVCLGGSLVAPACTRGCRLVRWCSCLCCRGTTARHG